MNEYLLSLAAGVLPEASPMEMISAASAAGFKASGIWVEPERFSHDYWVGVRRAADDQGMLILDAEYIGLRAGPLDPAHLQVLDIAAVLGAAHVLVVSFDPDLQATIEKLAQLCDYAKGYPLRLVLEFGAFTEVITLQKACAIIREVGRSNLGVLIDSLHLQRSGGTLEQVQGLPGEWVTYMQLCDAPAQGPSVDDREGIYREAVDLRLLPGDGQLPLYQLLAALPGGPVPLSLEIRSESLRRAYPDFVERAKVLMASAQKWLLEKTV